MTEVVHMLGLNATTGNFAILCGAAVGKFSSLAHEVTCPDCRKILGLKEPE